MGRVFQQPGIRAIAIALAFVIVLLPTLASAQSSGTAPRPTGVRIAVSLECLGDRGAIAVITVENAGRTPVTLVEVAPAFEFRGPMGDRFRLEVFLLIIPTTIEPGETLIQEVTVVDAFLPPDPWVSFHERVTVDVTLWFDGYTRPLTRRVVTHGCTTA